VTHQSSNGSDVDPLLACRSLLNIMSFAIGSIFANLAGTGLLSRQDAADRLQLLAQTLSTVQVDVPQLTQEMARRLVGMADVIAKATPALARA
jgi:hypothetical protein